MTALWFGVVASSALVIGAIVGVRFELPKRVLAILLSFAAGVAKRAKVGKLVGEFIPTPKNKVAADMYARLGFRKLSDTLFGADPSEPIFESPRHIKPDVGSFLAVA